MHEGSQKAVAAALAANIGIAISKFIGFFFTGAASMLAEAVHSLADCGNQALLMFGGARADRAATALHPFGYARERYFWAFIVALIIFLLGGSVAIYEGIEKLIHPHELSSPLIAVGILLVGFVLESLSFRTAIHEANLLRGERTWVEFIRGTKAAELPVILLEDFGALIGLCFALIGIGLSVLTHEPRFDAMGSVAIGVLLVFIAAVLATEMRSLLVGEAASDEIIHKIEHALLEGGIARRVIHMRTSHLGPEELLVAAKLAFDQTMQFADVAREIDAAEARVRAVVPIAKLIYIEPDVWRC
ncbi:MAG TPA: cation diffusion facilitator family transporter [Polyangiales bacterium]|jgi:cation diffusion facilitator family transporter|nr:cation diffusion facilitator family transporter [Polyangiales bacterium]